MNFKITIIVLLLPYSLFAQTPKGHDLPHASYIPWENPLMFCLVGNSLCIRDQTKDSIVFDELLQFPNLDVEIKKGTSKKILDSSEKKALAIALLRLSVKNPSYVFSFPKISDSLKKTYKNKDDYISNYTLSVGNFTYSINVLHNFSIIQIKSNLTSNKERNTSFFADGTYISRELSYIFNLFFLENSTNANSPFEDLLSLMTSYSKKDLVEIFDFASSFVKEDIRLFATSYSLFEKRNVSIKSFQSLSVFEKKSIVISLLRSLFITDCLIYQKKESDGVVQGYSPPERECIYILYNNKNLLSLEYAPNFFDYANASTCVLLKNFELEGEKLQEISDEKKSPLFNGPKEFLGDISYFSPELYKTMLYLLNKYK